MAKQRKPSGRATPNTGGEVPSDDELGEGGDEDQDEEDDDENEVKPKANKRARIIDEEDEWDEDDDEWDEDDDDEDEMELPPEVVPNDDSELLAFLRTAVKEKASPLALADWLQDRDDPRAPLVQELLAPQPVIPADPLMRVHCFSMVSSPQWWAVLQFSRVVVTPYPGTLLFEFLLARGEHQAVVRLNRDRRTPESIRAAFERCRLRLVLALFDTTEADMKATRTDPLAARVGRLVRSLRRSGPRAVERVCDEAAASPELGAALVRALSHNEKDHRLWEAVMNRLNPGWRTAVALKPMT